MILTDELRKLANLHQEGHLTDAEFSDAKQRLITDSRALPTAPPSEPRAVPDPAASIVQQRYWSSRWSSGNLFFRDSLTLASDGMTFRKGALIGSSEEHINYRAVASVRVTNGLFLADVCIETTGGSQPIFINGLWKAEAKEVQDTLRACQGKG